MSKKNGKGMSDEERWAIVGPVTTPGSTGRVEQWLNREPEKREAVDGWRDFIKRHGGVDVFGWENARRALMADPAIQMDPSISAKSVQTYMARK